MKELIWIAAPVITGMSELAPKQDKPKWAFLFAAIGVTAGATGIALAFEGKLREALAADALSIFFDILSIKKALEVE